MQALSCGVSHEWRGVKGRQIHFYGRRREEYMADIELNARRVLSPQEWMLFQLHILAELPWRACCPRMRLDRGPFFHMVYRVERKLGVVFRELAPYNMLPAEYFSGYESPAPEHKRREWYAVEGEGRQYEESRYAGQDEPLEKASQRSAA
jgi:hypothetical protein